MRKSIRFLKKQQKKSAADSLELANKIKEADASTKLKYANLQDYNEYVNGRFVKVILQAAICQYDKNSDELINEYVGTFENIFKKIDNYENYYYRFKKYKDSSIKRVEASHFGIGIVDRGSFYIDEADIMNRRLNYYLNNLYVIKDDKKFIPNHLLNDLAYLCYDYKIYLERYKERDLDLFNNDFDKFKKRFKGFVEVKDLNEYNRTKGILIMVLDDYRSFYVEKSDNIKMSVEIHWSKDDYYAGHGIDLFKAKDTTAIYVYKDSENIDDLYQEIISDDFYKYSLNENNSGKYNGISLSEYFGNDEENTDSSKDVLNYHDLYQMVNKNKNIFL